MTKARPGLSAVVIGRRLLSCSLMASSRLVASSLAIHHPLQNSYGCVDRRRIRTPSSGRLWSDKIQSSAQSILLASQSPASSNDDAVHAMTNGRHDSRSSETSHTDEVLSIWPRMDDLDKRMMKIALPCIANFAINPLIGAVDLFWVNRMGNALAVAGRE